MVFFILGVSKNLAATARKLSKNLHYVFCVEDCVLPCIDLVAGICFAFASLQIIVLLYLDCLFRNPNNYVATYYYRESGCQTHAVTCGAGTGVYLLIRVSPLFLVDPSFYLSLFIFPGFYSITLFI